MHVLGGDAVCGPLHARAVRIVDMGRRRAAIYGRDAVLGVIGIAVHAVVQQVAAGIV